MPEPETILVVEDNEQNLELVEFLLDEAGIKVWKARDAEEARALRPGSYIFAPRLLPEPARRDRVNLLSELRVEDLTGRQVFVYGLPEAVFEDLIGRSTVVHRRTDKSRRYFRLVGAGAATVDVLDDSWFQYRDKGFLPAIRRLLKAIPKERQTLFFSATMPQEINRLAAEMLTRHRPVQVRGDGAWLQPRVDGHRIVAGRRFGRHGSRANKNGGGCAGAQHGNVGANFVRDWPHGVTGEFHYSVLIDLHWSAPSNAVAMETGLNAC